MSVQVFGPPEDRALEDDEALCTDAPRPGVHVFFHTAAQMMPGNVDGWHCSDCTFSTVRVVLQ